MGTSSTARELRGLYNVLSQPAISAAIMGKTVQLNMDSMCSVRNLLKGGGSVKGLVVLIKDIWVVCRELGARLLPRWQRRNELMMQKADDLSKVHTLWSLRSTFVTEMVQLYGVTPVLPDVAKAGKAIAAVLARGSRAALILPVWEGQSWWALAQRSCKACIQLHTLEEVVHANGHGFPRWDFCMCIF